MLRAALQGAGTFVWEWDIDSDALGHPAEGPQPLGYPRELLPRTRQAWNRLIHPDDRAASHAAYLRHARGETDTHEHLCRVQAHDGGWHWCRERGRIVERHADGRPRRMVGTRTDVTEQHARDEAGAAATVRLERVAQHVPGVLYQFELDAACHPRFAYVSERSLPVFGLNHEALVAGAASLLDRIDAEDRRRLRATITESASRLALWRCEFRLRRPDGVHRWVLAVASPQRTADGAVVWHGYAQDVSELRELQRARQDKAAAEAANAAKTEFLSRMSHELRTPLNAVLGFAQLLELDRVDPLSEGQRRRVRLIRDAGDHLLRMIGDLLDLTRIEAGQLPLELLAVPLQPLAAEVLGLLQPQADAAGVRLQLEVHADAAALADRTRLRQVLLNLLSNAIKYNRPQGEVALRVEHAAGADGAPEVRLLVRDTGAGIAAADLPHVFEPFNRLAQAGSAVDGSGIGLAVTHALVQLMHGRIDVCSRPGEGSTFGVTLPAAS